MSSSDFCPPRFVGTNIGAHLPHTLGAPIRGWDTPSPRTPQVEPDYRGLKRLIDTRPATHRLEYAGHVYEGFLTTSNGIEVFVGARDLANPRYPRWPLVTVTCWGAEPLAEAAAGSVHAA